MRKWLRIATVAGVALAWAGLWLVWERWTSLSDSDTTAGFDLPEATPFWMALIVVTVLAAGYLIKPWLAIPLTIAALILAGLAGRAALDLLRTSGTFVDVRPGLGLWLCLAGAALLVLASWPRPVVLAAGLVPLLVLIVFSGTHRPAGGEVSEAVTKDIGTTMALDGDTILTAAPTMGSRVMAWDPDGERDREAFDTSDIKSSFAEDIQALAVHGDDLYLSVTNHGVWKIPADGRPTMLAIGPVKNPDGAPAGNPKQIPNFHPSRLVAAPDGSVYVLSDNDVYLYDGETFEPLNLEPFDAPQDIAVDRRGRLYVADTGNGRVMRFTGDGGNPETLIGASATTHCARRGQAEPGSLDPTHCHAIEALTVDSKGNLFAATGGIPRVLALTAEGRFGVVAGTGVAGRAKGDGRAVSARHGAINKLEIGPHDDLYIGEYERVLRVADPISGLGGKPGLAPAGPRDVCQAIGKWGADTLRTHLVFAGEEPSLDDLRAAINRLEGEDELKEELNKPYIDQDSLDGASTATGMLQAYGEEHCGLMDGLYPLDAGQAMRFCGAYAREWERDSTPNRSDEAARASAALLGPEILPPRAPRTPNWDGQVSQFAQSACAISYRWATRHPQ